MLGYLLQFIYTALYVFGLPFFFLRLWIKSWQRPAYAQRWRERLALSGKLFGISFFKSYGFRRRVGGRVGGVDGQAHRRSTKVIHDMWCRMVLFCKSKITRRQECSVLQLHKRRSTKVIHDMWCRMVLFCKSKITRRQECSVLQLHKRRSNKVILDLKNKRVVWVHAASVGEVNAVVSLVRALLDIYPQQDILFTTMTPTGAEQVKRVFPDLPHMYIPFDLPSFHARFLRLINPVLVLVVETELWPNMFAQIGKRGVPLLLVNARLSRRSARSYARVSPLFKRMLSHVSYVTTQSEMEARRFKALGVAGNKIMVMGSVKYDSVGPSDDVISTAIGLRKVWGGERFVFIAASTHAGEDEIVLRAFSKLREVEETAVLILVPRHPERAEKILSLISGYDWCVQRRSCDSFSADVDVCLVDSIGELMLFYAAADVVFVGGSLVKHGGQNIIEPALLSKPILVGPYMFNFTQVLRQFLAHKAVEVVDDEVAFVRVLLRYHADRKYAADMGIAAGNCVLRYRGAVERYLELIAGILSSADRIQSVVEA